MAVKASYTITLVRVDDGTDATLQSATAPSDKTKLWCDTSVTPPTLKRWDGTKWTIVNDFEIGGRNYFKGGYGEWSNWITPGTGKNKCINTGSIDLAPINFKAGDTVSLQIEFECRNFTSGNIWAQGASNGSWGGTERCFENPWNSLIYIRYEAGSMNKVTRATKTYTFPKSSIDVINSFGGVMDAGFRVDDANAEAQYRFRKIKFERGNKATDWAPAPEDQELTQSPTPPANKENLWCDTSLKPPMIKRWEGTKWIIVNDYTENISTAKKEVTEEYTSAINIVKNEINQNVSKLDTTVYKFETGSGNIFDNCNQYVSKNSSSSKEIMSYDMPFGLDLDTLRNKDICISTEVFARKSIPKSLLGYMGAEFTITFTDNTTQKIATYFMPSTFYLQYYSESGTNDIDQRIYTHYKVLDKAIKLVSNMKIIIAINGESLRVANPKVEFGVYPTGFEFDMHDMRDSVTTIESNYTKMDMKIDSISLQAVSLTQEVTSIKGNVSTLETRLQSTELKLTPTNITAMVNEKIGSDGSIKTTKVTIDKTGLSVYGGGMAIYNNANQKVFYADGSGNLTLTADIKTPKATIDSNGLSIRSGGMAIYNNANQKVFYADGDGNMVASNSKFSGDITGSKITGSIIDGTTITGVIGNIGGWNVDNNGFSNGAVKIDKNGITNIYTWADIYIIRLIIAGTITADEDMVSHYDFNGDGRISSSDYVKLKNKLKAI